MAISISSYYVPDPALRASYGLCHFILAKSTARETASSVLFSEEETEA